MAANCHLGFVEHVLGPPMKLLSRFVIVQNSVGINAVGSFETVGGDDNGGDDDDDDIVVVVVVAAVNDTTADSASKFCLYISRTVGVHSCSYPNEGDRS